MSEQRMIKRRINKKKFNDRIIVDKITNKVYIYRKSPDFKESNEKVLGSFK